MLPNGSFIEIKYEEFLETPVKIFKRLLDFLKFERVDSEEKTQEFEEKVVSKMKKNNTYKWKSKMSRNDIRIFEITAGEQLEAKGYEILNKNYRGQSLSPASKSYHYARNLFAKAAERYL